MLKLATRLTAVLAVLAAAPLASAQEKAATAGSAPRIGIGIGLGTFSYNSLQAAGVAQPGADIYVPIDLGALRIEPSLGLARWSADNNGGEGSSLNLGCGVLLQLRPGKTTTLYVGGRLFLDFVSATAYPGGLSFSDSGLDFTLAGVLGAEWYADPRFSIGAEARLGDTIASTLSNGGHMLRNGSNVLSTSGVVFFRFYL